MFLMWCSNKTYTKEDIFPYIYLLLITDLNLNMTEIQI